MCLILDANKYGDFCDTDNEHMRPVREWIEKNGKIVYSPTEKIGSELKNYPPMRRKLNEYSRAGKLKLVKKEYVEREQQDLLKKQHLKSDDPHIIALGLISQTKLLVSGDRKLHTDFKDIVGGRVYQNEAHVHLLKADICP